MHPERPEAVTRALFAEWTAKLDREGATPAVVIGVSHAEPGRVVVCVPKDSTLDYLRALLAHTLAEIDALSPASPATTSPLVPSDRPRSRDA